MNSLLAPKVSSLLARLFRAAEDRDATIRRELAQRSADERAAFMQRAHDDYLGFYGTDAHDLFLPVSQETGRLLYMLARMTRARAIVEFGTSFGLSTLHLAAALRDNGGGRLIGSEFVPAKVHKARAHVEEAGFADLVEIRAGDATETLARDLPTQIDLVLLDGAKVLYPKVLALLEPHLSPGAVLIADNADDSPAYLERVRDRTSYLSVPFAADVEVSLRVA